MMRRILYAVAAMFGVGLLSTSHAQTQAELTAQDRAFYAARAAGAVVGAPSEVDQSWSASGRGGIVRYAAADANRCRTFFLRQFNPEVRPAVTGKLCPVGGGDYAASDIRLAVAAGPSGGGTRGIVVRPVDPPSPPPQPPPATPEPPQVVTTPGVTDARPIRGFAKTRSPVAKSNQPIRVKPVLVQIGRATPRHNQNLGHAVVLLQQGDAAARARNLQLCNSLLNHFDDAPLSDVLVGLRREADGSISALRPIYWPVNERLQVSGSSCAQRLQRYDYDRARTIRDKLRIAGAGPYLVVTKSDERQAAVIDLTGMNAAQIEQATRYFSEGFSQRGDVWNPQQFTPREQERSLIAVFGRDFPRVVLAAVRITSAAGSTAAAAATGGSTYPVSPCLGDLTDTRRC